MAHFGKPPPQRFDTFDPIPAGEVTEGNEDSDWAAWEESVAFQDSQMPDFQGTVTVTERASRKPDPTPPAPTFERTGPVVEVIEGNEEHHWNAWEESVMLHDSQFQALQSGAAAPKKPVVDASSEHVDIFASVHKNSA